MLVEVRADHQVVGVGSYFHRIGVKIVETFLYGEDFALQTASMVDCYSSLHVMLFADTASRPALSMFPICKNLHVCISLLGILTTGLRRHPL